MSVHLASPSLGLAATPLKQHHSGASPGQGKSSPTAASVDSFSSYINKDAPGFSQRTSSPRLEDQLRDNSDPASQPSRTGSPQPRALLSQPIMSREPFRSAWTSEQPIARHHAVHAQAIDVNQLSSSNLAQKNEQDRQHSLEHDGVHSKTMVYTASMAADDSFETSASMTGDDSRGEVRRRRRTRPDEANLLVEAYLENAFPDHEARLALANQVGMSVRAVSVWFQNRRQAEKKRSGRYSGNGIKQEDDVDEQAERDELAISQPAIEQGPQRKPLGNATANGAPAVARAEQPITDFSINNKENIPPHTMSRSNPVQQHIAKLKRSSSFAKEAAQAVYVVSKPRSVSRDLRAMVGPDGVGLDVTNASEPVAVAAKSIMTRHRSTPRLSLDQVLSGRGDRLRRSNTDQAGLALGSSDIEQDGLDTILPPRNILSRSSSMSLLTTAGGRASLGNLGHKPQTVPQLASLQADAPSSLNSRLPPVLTAVLQKQGIISVRKDVNIQQGGARQVLLEKMPDSSVSSSDFDVLPDQREDRIGCDEDEERTLKMIAQRRATKAHAAQLLNQVQSKSISAEASSDAFTPASTEAREALTQARPPQSTVVGLSRGPSLEWAAGRDRARTTAMPHSVAGTPFSRSVSAQHDMRAPEMMTAPLTKRSSAPSRSVSATDLTKRLQAARRKELAANLTANRKRPVKAVINDENVVPSQPEQDSLKRRRQQEDFDRNGRVTSHGDVWLTDAENARASRSETLPMLSGRPLMPHPSFPSDNMSRVSMGGSGVPLTPTLYSSTLPLNSRSDRYRAIGASPAGSLGRSISASYQLGRGLPQSRESSAREQQGRAWEAIRPASQEVPGSARSASDDTWGMPLSASTPSRALAADRSLPRSTSMASIGNASFSSFIGHDDSGFFSDGFSDNEDQPARKRALLLSSTPGSISPRKASLRSNAVSKDSRYAKPPSAHREGDDHHAAQLLLGLGKTVDSREGSSQ